MSLLLFYEACGVIISVILAVLFAASPLRIYDLQLSASLLIIYLLFRKKITSSSLFFILESVVFIFVVVLVVMSTGGLSSPFFFLLYFLLLVCALLLEPLTSLVLAGTLIIVFVAGTDYVTNLKDLLPVISLPFIAPFAKYMGDLQRKYAKQKYINTKIQISKQAIQQHKNDEKEQTLLFLTTLLYQHIEDMENRLTNFFGDNDLAYLRKKMQKLHELVHKFKEYVETI